MQRFHLVFLLTLSIRALETAVGPVFERGDSHLANENFPGLGPAVNQKFQENRNEDQSLTLQNIPYPNKNNKYPVFYSHKFTNFFCWGILVDIGIIAIRFGKNYKHWLNYHTAHMTFIALASITVIALMISPIYDHPQLNDVNLAVPHNYIGFTFLALISLQLIGGYILRYLIFANEAEHLRRIAMFHRVSGHFINIIGKVEVGVGFYMMYSSSQTDKETPSYSPGNIAAFWAVYGFVFFWRILIEIYFFTSPLTLNSRPAPQVSKELRDNSLTTSMVDYISSFMYTQGRIIVRLDNEILKGQRDIKWVLFNNQIVDLTGLTHPGGQYIWNEVYGREVSRFIYGAYGLETSLGSAHKHSKFAIDLINRRTIGKLDQINFYIENNCEVPTRYIHSEVWVEIARVSKSSSVSLFQFRHSSLRIKSFLSGQQTFGKYFLIRPAHFPNVSTRPYTMVLSATDYAAGYRGALIQAAEKVLKNQSPDVQLPADLQLEEFPLMIKYYKSSTGFSQFIHANPNQYYFIDGPYGIAFPLPADGNLLIVCGGTGLFPFLDYLDFLLKQTLYFLVQEQRGEQEADKLNSQKLDFHKVTKVTFVMSLADQSEMICSDIYISLVKYQKMLRRPFFQMILRVNAGVPDIPCVDTSERFDEAFFRNRITDIQKFSAVMICGPPRMNREIPNCLARKFGMNKSLIHIV